MAEGNEYDQPGMYEIRVKGKLGKMWSDWFDDFEITANDEKTLLTGYVTDQAALHGLLNKIRDVGLTLLSINRIGNREEG